MNGKYKKTKAFVAVSLIILILGLMMMNDYVTQGGFLSLIISSFVYYKEKKELKAE